MTITAQQPPQTTVPTTQPPCQAPSRAAGKGTLGVQAGEAAEGPDGEDVPIVGIVDDTGLVEDTRVVVLKEHREINTKALAGG